MNRLGNKIDQMYSYREDRKQLELALKEIREVEAILEHEIYALLNEQGLKQAAGASAQFSMTTKEVPSIDDWAEVYDYIMATGEFGLLHKRISLGLWKELVDEGVVVPGTHVTELASFTLRVKK